MAENIFGADLKPNGKTMSTYKSPSQLIPSSLRSLGCIGMFLYACSMSIFASNTVVEFDRLHHPLWHIVLSTNEERPHRSHSGHEGSEPR